MLILDPDRCLRCRKEYKEDSLFDRIKKASEEHILTPEMTTWAHEIRLDANDQRHSDESTETATKELAQKYSDFAFALAEF